MNHHQADVIAYLFEEHRVLKEQRGEMALRLNDDQRRRLAAKAKLLGRRALNSVATIVIPDTLMRWHRKRIALERTYSARGVGRPGLMKAIKALIVRFALEDSSWGYCRIQGELEGVGHRVATTTIANVLKENGIEPAPDRPPSWRSFLREHWGRVAATDSFMGQFARNLTDAVDGFLMDHRVLICDRDTNSSPQFKRILRGGGVDVALTPRQAPNCNVYVKRLIGTLRRECLDHVIVMGEEHARQILAEFATYYNEARRHAALDGDVPAHREVEMTGSVTATAYLGGMHHGYARAA